MSALDVIQFLTQALYIVVFGFTLWTAIRHPRVITVETALLFGAAAVSVALDWAFGLPRTHPPRLVMDVSTVLGLAIPYLLLRLVDEFAGVPPLIQRLVELVLAAAIALRIMFANPLPLGVTLFAVGYFALVTLYVTWAYAIGAQVSVGSTARRMGSVAIGCGLLCLAVLIAGVGAIVPSLALPLGVVGGPFGLASGLAFYLGFSPPGWILRSWREPELREFLDRLDELAEQQELPVLLRELQISISRALGLRGAFAGIWEEDSANLVYCATIITDSVAALPAAIQVEGTLLRTPPDALIAGIAFSQQRSIYTEDVDEMDPANAAIYHGLGVKAVIAAPMTIGDQRYGVLGVFAPRPRMFGEESLARVEAMARHAAHMLRGRHLLERAAAARAEEQLTRLKEDFLSSATHDLRTPLTAIRGSAQLALSKAGLGSGTAEFVGYLTRIVDAVDRMAGLIDEVLDVSRLQMARPLELSRDAVDLVGLLRLVAERHQSLTSRHQILVEGPARVDGHWDGRRLERVFDNLLGNAVKFSPDGGGVSIIVEATDACATVSVRDHGLGIGAEDLDRIFERFERGGNSVAHGIGGTGIGLAYVREVVTAHGGQVHAESEEGQGSIFVVKLPRADACTDAVLAEIPAA